MGSDRPGTEKCSIRVAMSSSGSGRLVDWIVDWTRVTRRDTEAHGLNCESLKYLVGSLVPGMLGTRNEQVVGSIPTGGSQVMLRPQWAEGSDVGLLSGYACWVG